MKHIGTQTIETKRLILRRFELNDAKAMYETWAHDADVSRYTSWQPHKDLHATQAYISNLINQYINPTNYNWVIELKESKQIIGTIDCWPPDGEVGYCIAKKYWHQGYTSEALLAVIDFMFNKVGLKRLYGVHLVDNVNSGKVMLKCNMIYDGIIKEGTKNNEGKRVDCACYHIMNPKL